MKVFTKRHGEAPPLEDARILLRTAGRLQGGALIPKGTYRFKTFEEADRWMIKTIANTHARRNSKTSSLQDASRLPRVSSASTKS